MNYKFTFVMPKVKLVQKGIHVNSSYNIRLLRSYHYTLQYDAINAQQNTNTVHV